MTVTRWLHLCCGLFLVGFGLACFGPWYESGAIQAVLSLSKLLSLVAAAVTAFVTFGRHEAKDAQRRSWLAMALGLCLYAAGQATLSTYQIILDVRVPFPSLGDFFFVASYPFIIWALFSFGLVSFRSGLPLGRPAVFWAPAVGVAVALVAAVYPLVAPVLAAGDPILETTLNLAYPLISFVTLAPCLVMIRVGWKFRGGKLLLVWLPLTMGFAAMLVSDILFAFFTSLDLAWLEPVVDFLYASGYLLIFRGALSQARLMRRRAA